MERLFIFVVGLVVGILARNKFEKVVAAGLQRFFPNSTPEPTNGLNGRDINRWRSSFLDR
jgi:hypothetical protein